MREPNHTGPTTTPRRHHRLEVDVAPVRRELVAAHLWACGATGVLERPTALVAWFAAATTPAAPASPPDLAAAVPELDAAALRWSLEADRDWQAEWKATIAPVRAGRTVVVPTWLADEHEPAPDELTLALDPGRAFGSGHHATTTLCLELLDGLDHAGELRGRTVADVGCGTGVLAIAAAARGAHATAVDIDPDAVTVTRENAVRNAVELHATVGSVADLPAPAEVVVANLVTDVVIALAPALVAATTNELIVSGIAAERCDRALGALRASGADVLQVHERDGWVAARLAPAVAAASPRP